MTDSRNKVLYGEQYVHRKKVVLSRKCCFCKHFKNKKCVIKKVKVNPKKRRKCDYFDPDALKVRLEKNKKQQVIVTKRPDWFWLDKEAKKKFIIMTGVMKDE